MTPVWIKDSRPQTLAELSNRVSQGHPYVSALKVFIDVFIGAPDPERIQEAPKLLGQPLYDVHLAGIAETLAAWLGVATPEWCEARERYLDKPIFFGGEHSRAFLIEETPPALRKRQLYCGAVLLKRRALRGDGFDMDPESRAIFE